MTAKSAAYLDLVRLPNVFTAVADVWAGYLLASGSGDQSLTLAALALGSALVYAGGVALNDVADVAEDARDRPSRPIPSGRIARRHAAWLGAGLLLAGLGAFAMASPRTWLTAPALLAAIVLYDFPMKRTVLGPAVMGSCRALNLATGVAASGAPWNGAHALAAALLAAYVTAVSVFARDEASGGGRRRLVIGAVGVVAACSGTGGIYWLVPSAHFGGALFAGALAAGFAFVGGAAIREPDPSRIQRAVKRFVLGVVAFDACLVWIIRGPWAAAAVIVWWAPSVIASRAIRVT